MGRTSFCARILRLYERKEPWCARGARTFAGAAKTNVPAAAKVMLVESPAKAKKIQEFLGGQCRVLASYGHVRDLPAKAGSVDPSNGFGMRWEALQHAEKHVRTLEEVMRGEGSVELLLATDPDREGEAISWHVLGLLKERGVIATNVQRITFTEITKEAVLGAMDAPRDIDENLVRAYLARRAVDYLLGFHLSPILWRKLPGASSAGRVQSVALRMICEREDEIDGFKQSMYWTVHGVIRLPDGSTVRADVGGAGGTAFSTLEDAERVSAAIHGAGALSVEKVAAKRTSRQPQPPFTTSTMHQEANTRLGFGASKTMQLAQELYEGGIITYMRTDSFSMSPGAVECIRDVIRTKFGEPFVPPAPKVFTRRKAVNAQEAHEAVRPTDPSLAPQAVAYRGYGPAAVKLYELIRDRALASQSENAASDSVAVVFACGNAESRVELRATGSKIAFSGYLEVLGRDEDPSGVAVTDYEALSKLEEGQTVTVSSSHAEEHTTKAPPRFTEGSLIKAMEEHGIGRPSTYAPTLKLLYARNYVKSSKKRLHAEPIGRILTSFLKLYAPEYVDYSYTSTLEGDFDRISHGDQDWMDVMQEFWAHFEEKTKHLSELSGTEVLDALNEDMATYLFRRMADGVTTGAAGGLDGEANATLGTSTVDSKDPTDTNRGRTCPSCQAPLSLKLSHKGGPFIGCSQYPTCSYTRPLPSGDDDFVPTMAEDIGNAFKSMNVAEQYGMRGPVRLLGTQPGSDAMIFVRQGPYGPYIQVGLDKDPGMKRVPLPKDSKPRSLTLKYALSMLELPRTLGDHPDTGAPVEVRNGKFGPFILHGSRMRSIPKTLDPLDLSLDEALNLLQLSSENKKFPSVSKNSARSGGKDAPVKKRAGGRDAPPTPSDTANAVRDGTRVTADTANAVGVPRARSAYQFFLKDYLSKEKMKNGKEKMKIMGQTWKALPDSERGTFQSMAEEDALRVRIQEAGIIEPNLEAWEALDSEAKRALGSQLASEGSAPGRALSGKSRPTSAYTLFMQDVSEQIKREKLTGVETTNRGSFMTLVAKKWRDLSDEERAKYEFPDRK